MAKFKFGKGQKGKDRREDDYREDLYEEDLSGQNREGLYYESGEEDFFDDDFGTITEGQDLEDLDTDADSFASDLKQDMDYTGYEPKWYEKGTNLIITFGILLVIVASSIYYFREPLRVFVGTTSEELQEIDLRGEVDDYAGGVKETLTREETIQQEEEEDYDLEEVDYVSDGEYLVGADIEAGIWIAKDVLVDVYESKEAFEEVQDPISSNVRTVEAQKVIGLSNGQYVHVQGGELVLNRTRPEKVVNVRDTMILRAGDHLIVGNDLPEGFYTLYNTDILEEGGVGRVRKININKLNPQGEEPKRFGVERKSTVFLRQGLIFEAGGDLIAERVSADGTYGDDGNLLHEMSSEELDEIDTERKEMTEEEIEELKNLGDLLSQDEED